MPAILHAMDMDADKDYLQYLEKLCRHPEYSLVHSSQAFAQNLSNDARSPSSNARSQPSFDLSGIWPLMRPRDRLLGIEKGIGKAKEGIRSKRFIRGSQEVRNRAPCGRTVPSCDLTCPWERFGMNSADRAVAQVQSQSCIFVDRAITQYRLAESKLRLKLEFHVSGPGPSLF
ncbi:hypothetical protein PIB30_045917 [Stylosanthes scabra]|uniref:Uncharacterized protein n=1 Tax=Stylosanthes scabra TaxID=79078 RepID=A0ABU6XHX3_9FABA|nr:hypothetical protein [Stylosanthes scabra]